MREVSRSRPASAPLLRLASRGDTARGTLVVAGLSVRALAESARQDGWAVIALDLFGDADTRAASRRWLRIGDPASLRIDAMLLGAALRRAARYPGVAGWIAGSGFDADPGLLDAGADALPLLGLPAAGVRRVRDMPAFFRTLDDLGLAHPEVSAAAPASPEGWLAKRAGGCGGWHIRPAAQVIAAPALRTADTYFQRERPGTPVSALFLADGSRARLVALNQLIVGPHAGLGHVYAGAVGPVVDALLAREIERALCLLVPAFGMRGLASLDFIIADGTPWLLEINPRPSASMVLHAQAWPGGLVRAHVEAVGGRLPRVPPCHPGGVRGQRTVFAEHDGRVDASLADSLAEAGYVHDLPLAGARIAAGAPICSVSAQGPDLAAVRLGLARRATQVHARLAAAAGVAGDPVQAVPRQAPAAADLSTAAP